MRNINLAIILLSVIVTNSAMATTGKVTLEMANEDMRKAAEGINYVDSEHGLDEPKIASVSDNGKLKEVWTGSATTVANQWGQGDYYVEMTFNKQNTAGSVWLTVDNTNLKKSVAVPSPYNYEANWHIMYERGVFRAEGLGKGSTTPSITRIAKFPTPQLNDCTAGQTESELLYCTGSFQTTCEEGQRIRTCATNGGWLPWQTNRQPSCVTDTQQCR